ncbi:hypothetical protein L593_14450 [Salinarchaeum sp. Harcht-Bsk1]|uniref:ester cyclase n=1 Tax=Salinarchaeum sp. Harcht-Bsk1 TaxID=1333523 RepID=UPI000342311B|nr:ester cyclase [Salinarchaeum sp. Harcht-Bsk1]AGN02829.1 hypothetical protein L593_14450 [Salinarchaeum sp. Harcht-Bsk1]
MATTQSPTDKHKQLARRVPEDVATEHKLDVIDEITTEDVVDHTPMGDAEGRDELKAEIAEMIEAFPDFSATVEEIFAEDDLVSMRVTLRGTHEGELWGMEPTGNTFEVPNNVVTRIEDGLIAERWLVLDTMGMLRQLGLVDLPME